MIFFSDLPSTPMQVFGPLHIALIAAVIAGIILIYRFRAPLRKFGHEKTLRYLFAGILFANMTIYYVGMMFAGCYDVKKHLPLEFCFITGYLFMYILISENKKLFRIVYFFTLMGPLPAILWPNLTGTFDRYVFYQFIISHHIMLLMSIYTLVVFRYRVSFRDMIPAFFTAMGIFGVVFCINLLFGTNYIMQQKLPDTVLNLYPFLRQFDVPVFWLLICGLACLIAAGGLAKVLQRDRPRVVLSRSETAKTPKNAESVRIYCR